MTPHNCKKYKKSNPNAECDCEQCIEGEKAKEQGKKYLKETGKMPRIYTDGQPTQEKEDEWKEFDKKFGQNGINPVFQNLEGMENVKLFISTHYISKKVLKERIEKLQKPSEDVACDYADHIDRDTVLSILTNKQ